MNKSKEKALRKLKYEIILMNKYLKKNKISIKEISNKSEVPTSIVWKFLNGVSKEPSVLTFIMIAQAIGYEIEIKR